MELAPLPELTAQQLRLVHEVHAYWKRERRFPRVVAVAVPLRKEFDVREALGTMPPGVILRAGAGSEAEVLKLDVRGLSLCPGEERIVEAFLALVRDAAQQAIATPDSKPTVTRTMLRSLLHDLPKEDFDLVAPVIWDSLPGGGSQNEDEWIREPSLNIIRFENVRTMAEYLERAAVQPREVAVLKQEHVALLREVYSQWSKDGGWPSSRELAVAYRSKGDALRLLAEIPTRYLRQVEWSSLEGKPVVLTLDGIAFTDQAEADLAVVVEIIRILVGELEASPENAQITIGDVAQRSGVPKVVAKRIAKVMADAWLGVDLEENAATTTVRIRDSILTYEGARSFGDFLARREERTRRFGLRENDEMDEDAIRQGILRLFAAQPADGSRSLNRTNVAGRPTQSGELEYFLNRVFTMEERGRVMRALRQLEAEGLLVPTMTDIVAPEDWLVITKAGREALHKRTEPMTQPPGHEFDAFLCHASEDKMAVVARFASLMENSGLKPWWDAGQIGWGDSLIAKIERGLVRSRFVIVFVSAAFLSKRWPEKELRSALNMEVGGEKKVLPVVLGVDHATLEKSYPFLAEKLYVAIQSYDASREVAAEDLQRLLEALRGELSKLP